MPTALPKKAAMALAVAALLTGCNSDSKSNDNLNSSQVIYVSPDGTGNGTQASPTDLASGLALVRSGDTLRLLAGQYAQLSSPLAITADRLTIEGAGVGASILTLDTASACELISINANQVQLTDLEIDASTLTLAPDSCASAALIAANGDQLVLGSLAVTGGNPAPVEGAVELPAAHAYSLVSLQGSSNALTVEDLQLTDAPQHALAIQNADGDISITGLTVANAGYRGIYLHQVEGAVDVVSNDVNGAVNEGIYLRDVTGEVSILQNNVSNILYRPTIAGGSGIEGGIVHTNTAGVVVTTLRMNTVDIDPLGLNRALSGEPLLDIDGIEVNMLGTARGFALVEDNTVRNTDDDGIDTDTADQAELDIIIRNNTLSGMQDRSISFVATGDGVVRGLIEGNTITGPTVLLDNDDVDADGIGIRPRQNASVDVTVRNNIVNQPGRKGIDVNMNRGANNTGPVNNAVAVFRFENNTVTGAGQRGLDVQLEDTAQASGVLIDNTVTGADGDGIRVRSGAGDNASVVQTTQLSVAVIGNQVSNSAVNGDGGIFARVQRESRLCLMLEDNQSSNSSADQDYFLRSQQDSVLELQDLEAAIAADNPSLPLREALVATGNTGRDATFPVRVQNNNVRTPSNCVFVDGDLTPALPVLP